MRQLFTSMYKRTVSNILRIATHETRAPLVIANTQTGQHPPGTSRTVRLSESISTSITH